MATMRVGMLLRVSGNEHLTDRSLLQWTSSVWAILDTSSEWISSTCIRMKSALLSLRKTFTTDMICIQCESTYPQELETSTLNHSSRTDIVLAAICPEWFRLIEKCVLKPYKL